MTQADMEQMVMQGTALTDAECMVVVVKGAKRVSLKLGSVDTFELTKARLSNIAWVLFKEACYQPADADTRQQDSQTKGGGK